ncbi:hypothetical protein [Croceitalea rosinachiae]|uniref:Cellobiose phosphorylase n=1 Tax=Croceitalea rosinachiae TaxID=3075596 RepID=A0ABU3AD67_9FLAO|nr:hypothetical protein [Croceitalea sp. F388]MDT0608123.1 hypothetical protein [Croceitalea sp. F388]
MDYIQIENESYYKIGDSNSLRPFFMSIVSDSNHWMFISSNGGLSAGRKDSDNALFPYYTDDKITESFDLTGSKSIFQVTLEKDKTTIWEPFSNRYTGVFNFTRNLYKNEFGNKVIFEEVNHDLGLTFQYQWSSSNRFGFVRKSKLTNTSDRTIEVCILDGIQNIMPFGVGASTQQASSNLVDAYKRSELIKESRLGIFALSAIIVDKAEPSEALKANVVWSKGLENNAVLLSSLQLDDFRNGKAIKEELDIKAEKGAYFIVSEVVLKQKEEKEWAIIADVNKSSAKVISLSEEIKSSKEILKQVYADVEKGTENLVRLTAASDGKQLTSDKRTNARHYSNVLFNIMRGGIFDNNYVIEKDDFVSYIADANTIVFSNQKATFEILPEEFAHKQLKELGSKSNDKDFERLCLEYLPLKFSRRHGDPSRPWNRFSINTTTEEGKKILDYEGNWRDIFQNWEALAHSYPEFIESMIHKFVNATTFDGYNPYRVTKGGFDWEIIEPDDPWSYIGYWGDHQIIYLLKFLEFSENHYPGDLAKYFNEKIFVYANVPYKIKDYESILENPKDTIVFDEELNGKIDQERIAQGADAALLKDASGEIYRVTLLEKLLATVLAKVSNFIPEGGIWMNTQRPEWNDANNALVGNGVSMVTLNYLRRFLNFFETIVEDIPEMNYHLSKDLLIFFNEVRVTLSNNLSILSGPVSNSDRKKIMDGLGIAGSTYRNTVYERGFVGKAKTLSKDDILQFVNTTLKYLDHSIEANKRSDKMYHAYNLMTVENETEVSISYLSEMLEGQVAALSSGFISSKASLELLDGLKNSALFRPDQYSYLLYPNKELAKFNDRNNIPSKRIEKSQLVMKLLKNGNTKIVEKDSLGNYHFNGSFNNAESLKTALSDLPKEYESLLEKDTSLLLKVFEEIFDHKSFTGRSGTFFGYEGLGSIYWHMVSKLLLAVQETCLRAIRENESDEIVGRLLEHYYEINEGIGVHKSPELYGAFPTDPYSHTPAGKGAQQPGMTGQVKEDILSRFGELGVLVENGKLLFKPYLLRSEEFLKKDKEFHYVNLSGDDECILLKPHSLAFTYCQVPIIYTLSENKNITVYMNDKSRLVFEGSSLDAITSRGLFERKGEINRIEVSLSM